jgi:hypothetical protein
MDHIKTIAIDFLEGSRLWGEKLLPFEATLEPGHSRTILVAGENCSGKSFFVEGLRAWSHHHAKLSTICVSIRERTGAGLYEGASFRRAMMFGDETEHSTGATSVHATGTAFNTLRSRSQDDGKSAMLVLDEPELGLSEGFSRAMGTFIGQEVGRLHEGSAGVVVVTHSRALAQALRLELGEQPTFVKLGAPMGFETWLQEPEEHTVEELLELKKTDHERWRAVDAACRKK